MKISDLVPDFSAFKSKTNTALDETKASLAAANKTIADLSAKIEALASAKAADEDADSTDDSSEMDQFISDLQAVINKYTADKSDESDDSTDDTSDDSTDESDATPDDSDDANDEAAKKAARAAKLKTLATSVTKIVAENKKLKDELPKQVIRELAAIGMPTPVATKVDGQKPNLKGRALVAAAFNEQLTK